MSTEQLYNEKKQSVIHWLKLVFITEFLTIFRDLITEESSFIFRETYSLIQMILISLIVPLYTIKLMYILYKCKGLNFSKYNMFSKMHTAMITFFFILFSIITVFALSQY